MAVNLGEGMQAPAPSRDQLVFRSDIESEITRAMSGIERRLEQYVNARLKTPLAPTVNVHPTVRAPDITVTPSFSPHNDITISGLDALHGDIAGLRSDIAQLCTVLMRPITRTVTRDSTGAITRIVESR